MLGKKRNYSNIAVTTSEMLMGIPAKHSQLYSYKLEKMWKLIWFCNNLKMHTIFWISLYSYDVDCEEIVEIDGALNVHSAQAFPLRLEPCGPWQ